MSDARPASELVDVACALHTPRGEVEVGWYPLHAEPEARDMLPWPQFVYQWHTEGFDVPSGARLLAKGERFSNQAMVVGRNAFGIMLTGMGADGATAMREMKDAGSYNYVQDEASCVVFGMPREAIQEGAAHEVLPLNKIAPTLLQRLSDTAGQRTRI